MAKVSLTKLGLKVNQDFEMIKFNEQNIEVKQYLPVNEKLELMNKEIIYYLVNISIFITQSTPRKRGNR